MEPLTQTTIIPIEDSSQVATARRAAADLAGAAGLDDHVVSEASVVAVELANNLLQHAGSGALHLNFLRQVGALDIVAVDHGKGMLNIERCLEDGFSTRSTPGLGLGAVQRLSENFSSFSVPGRTTVIAARIAQRLPHPDFAVVSTAIQGETFSGDSWAISDDGNTILVVDGLGHGLFAADAARAAVNAFLKNQTLSPQEIVERMHAAMRSTRGAAAAVAKIHPGERTIDFAGVGNIVATILNRTRNQNLVSHNGTLGHQMRRVQQFQYSYSPTDLLVMQSDGLTTHSKTGLPPALLMQPPALIASFIYSEQVRGRDDATILVNRLG